MCVEEGGGGGGEEREGGRLEAAAVRVSLSITSQDARLRKNPLRESCVDLRCGHHSPSTRADGLLDLNRVFLWTEEYKILQFGFCICFILLFFFLLLLLFLDGQVSKGRSSPELLPREKKETNSNQQGGERRNKTKLKKKRKIKKKPSPSRSNGDHESLKINIYQFKALNKVTARKEV